jgi:CpeT/CpcT family (DUF1001)
MRHFKAIFGAGMAVSLGCAAHAQSLPPAHVVRPLARTPIAGMQARDLAAALPLLMKWWHGQFDNHEQIVRQSGGGLSPHTSVPFNRLHTDVKAVAAPALGSYVLLLSQYADNDPAKLRKRELLILSADTQANAIRVRRYSVPDWQQLDDPALAAKLQTADLRPLGANCDLFLRYAGGQFQGSLAAQTCLAASGNGAVGKADYDLIVGSSYMWERGQVRNARTGKVDWEMAPGSSYDWYQESRAQPFTCNVFASPGGEMAKSEFLQTIHLHDQGGEAEIAWPDGRTLMFTIHQRAFTAIPEHQYPLFRIHEKGKTVPIAYAYAVDQNKRFGLNLGWFYIRCYDDTDISPVDMLEARK